MIADTAAVKPNTCKSGLIAISIRGPPADIMPIRLLLSQSAIEKPDYNWLFVMARLKPGVNREEAQTEVSGLFRRRLEREASKVELRDKKEILDQRIELRPAGNGFADFDLSER